MKKFIQTRLGERWRIVLWLSVSICLSLSTLASAEVLRQAVSAIEHGDLSRIDVTIWLAVLTTLWVIAFEYINRIASQSLRNRFGTRLQTALLDHTLQIDKLAFSQKRTGETLTLLQDNTERAVEGTLAVLEESVYGAGMLLFSLIYMGLLSWQLMLVIVACNIVFRLLTRFFDKKIRGFSCKVIGHVKESNSFFLDVLRNELLIRVYRREQHFEDEFERREQEVARSGLAVFGTRNGYDEITWYASMLITLIFIYGVGGVFMLRGMLTFSVLIAFTKASDSFVKGMNSVISAVNDYNEALPHIQAVEEALSVPCEQESGGDVLRMGDICFQDVSFSFPGRPVFEHLNLTIPMGSQVMVTGVNGRGKSTLFGLLLGFYRPQSGKITIGGVDIAGYSSRELCRLFGYIPQEAHIFTGTLEQNFALTLPTDVPKTDRILRQLHLESVKNADPLRCSMGEKQRINIGRALYQGENRAVLLGDEIFANIDAANREDILQVLAGYGSGKTVLLICHEDFAYPFTHRLHLGETETLFQPVKEVRV